MRVPPRLLLVSCAAVAASLGAQSRPTAPTAERLPTKISPASDVHPGWLDGGAESPNGRFVVVEAQNPTDPGFQRYDRKTRSWAQIAASSGRAARMRWSPDGRFIAYLHPAEGLRGRYVWIVPMDSATGLATGAARRVTTRAGGAPVWTADGRHIALDIRDSAGTSIVSVPFNGGDEQVLYRTANAVVSTPLTPPLLFSPDGRFLYLLEVPAKEPARLNRVTLATKQVSTLRGGPAGRDAAGPPLFAISPDGSRLAQFAPSVASVAISSATDGHTIQRVHLPWRTVPAGWSHTSPNELVGVSHVVPELIERITVADGSIRPVTPVDSGLGRDPRYAPDGKRFAYGRPQQGLIQLVVADADGANARNVGHAGDIRAFAWSPSGQRLAYVSIFPSGVHVVDARSGEDRELVRWASEGEPPRAGVLQGLPGERIAWRGDEQAIRYLNATAHYPPQVRDVHEVTLDGKDRMLTTIASGSVPDLVNDSLVIVREPGGVQAVNLRTGVTRSLYKGRVRTGNHITASADGKWLAFVGEEGDDSYPLLLSLATAETRRIPYKLGGEITTLWFHPDGQRLIGSVCPTCNSGREKWEVLEIPMNGDPPRMFTAVEPANADSGDPSISPDGKTILFLAERSWNTRIVSITLPSP